MTSMEAVPPWTAAELAGVDAPRPRLDLPGYLDAVEAFFRRYVACPSEHEPVALALWVAHAHLVDQFETSPILAVTSAEMRSGKTRTLDCLELLVPHPFRVVTPSEAVVYTVLAQRPRRTMLLDEADAIFGPRTAERYEGLRAILNAGNRQGTPVLRVKLEGRRREVDEFDVFGPKAIAGIGKLPDTVSDRSIPVRLKRRAPGEMVAKFRRRTADAEAAAIRSELEGVTVVTDVTVPEELHDRAADSWEPLLAIADTAGGTWPARGRLAALALSSSDDTVASHGMRLLADIRDAFDDLEHLPTVELLRRLHNLDEAPWADWYGKALTARGLAKLLEPYQVGPLLRRLAGDRRRGYFRSDFTDAWNRYVPLQEPVTTVTTVPAGANGTLVTHVTGPDTHPEPATHVPLSQPVSSVPARHNGTDGTGWASYEDDYPSEAPRERATARGEAARTVLTHELGVWDSPVAGVADAARRDDQPAPSVSCRAFRAHQSHHRREGDGWVCDACRAAS